jgi:hypothetical protein
MEMHPMRDQYNAVVVRRAISPVSVADNTAQVSQIIDLQGFDACTFLIATGSIADADATFAVLVEHGDQANLSDAAAVPDEALLGTEAAAGFQFDDDNEVRKIGYRGPKRYLRLTVTPANNASAALIAAVALLGRPAQGPATQPAA